MKRAIKITVLFISILLLIVLIGYKAIKDRTAVLSDIPTCINNNMPNDSILRIGIIGDSWAVNFHKLNFGNYMDSLFIASGITSETFLLYGKNGIKTKDIYRNLIYNNHVKEKLNSNMDYCIVFGGINDLHGQYGPEYYSKHIESMIIYLLNHKITPIIIEIPDTYYLEQYKLYPLWKRMSYRILSLYTNGSTNLDNINKYRAAIKHIIANHFEDKMIYIQTDTIFNLQKSLYIDNMHINQSGYILLGNLIKKEILRHYNYENCN